MHKEQYSLSYPRRNLARGATRLAGRVVLPIAFRIHISGGHNFPKKGPLLVVGNHAAVMEAVLMAVYSPWQMEMLGTADIPNEWISEVAMRFFGFIPVRRGHMDRPAMTRALDVLEQDGVLGLFPEGGIWAAGEMRPQKGVAWLSCRSGAPVLPIGFGGTRGALSQALRLHRPKLTMNVGELLPAASLPPGVAHRVYFEEYATQVMDAVQALIPPEDQRRGRTVVNECFELDVKIREPGGEWRSSPRDVAIQHEAALARLLHSPVIWKTFRRNLRLDVEALQDISGGDAVRIADGVASVLAYLEGDNPYFLTYRFGARDAKAMQTGLQELGVLAGWVARSGHQLSITPIRRYYLPDEGREVVQTSQGEFAAWM